MKKFFTFGLILAFALVCAIAPFGLQGNSGMVAQANASEVRSDERQIDSFVSDAKVYSELSINNDFADNRILVVLNKQETSQFKSYRTSDFSDIGISKVEELSAASAELLIDQQQRKKASQSLASKQSLKSESVSYLRSGEMEINAEDFRTILCLTLERPGKQG